MNRLRQESKDLEPEDFRDGTEPVVRSLVDKYDLALIEFRPPGELVDGDDDSRVWRLPFDGSAVIVNRRPPEMGGERLPGRVVEKPVVVDGTRSKECWVEIPVQAGLAEHRERLAGWQGAILRDLVELSTGANASVTTFKATLRPAAENAVAVRLDKLRARGRT